ncbi:MAG: DEAD/DEAH box helicase [Candidatus Gracilibacteria bacterium]|nr:DEAD/DEAH box helicase [Candidatus Gracilibacteria bacterium]
MKKKAYQWLITEEGYIDIADSSGQNLHLTAREIFNVEFKGKKNIREIDVEKPSSILTTVSFSRYPVRCILLVSTIQEKIPLSAKNNYSIASCKIIAEKDGSRSDISTAFDKGLDHLLFDKVWYPFAPEDTEHIRQIFKRVGISGTGPMNLGQYVLLCRSMIEGLDFELETSPLDFESWLKGTRLLKVKEEKNPFFNGKLLPYQQDGFEWLSIINQENIGCILADQMGLGKTVQVIRLLTEIFLKFEDAQCLIVAPSTLLENWRREFLKFAPAIPVLLHRGADRPALKKEFMPYTIILVSYDTVLRDFTLFQMFEWHVVILDEAQAIKNPAAKRTRIIKSLERKVSIAVTGTPMENRLTDLWSIMDFANSGLLGSMRGFLSKFPEGIESAKKLEPMISPLILRRTIDQVALDLPDKIEIPLPLEMDEQMAEDYELVREAALAKYGEISAKLASIGLLRLFCTIPESASQSLGIDFKFNWECSPKALLLHQILEEVFAFSEKALIFTSYTKSIDKLKEYIAASFSYCWIGVIDGRLPVEERVPLVESFNKLNRPGVLIMNPRAAGSGLNITGGNHVIHFNPEWNPAVEDQATARAYRIGQKRKVTVHRFFYINTLEEIIVERLERKRKISATAIVGTDEIDKTTSQDIIRALNISPVRGRELENGRNTSENS